MNTPIAMFPEALQPQPRHGAEAPSEWVRRWSHLLPVGGRALDVACGAGRHAHHLAALGMAVTGIDRDAAALAQARQHWPAQAVHAPTLLQADIEGQPWPLPGQTFDAIVVTNYLWRPLWPSLLAALAPGGVYIHETFAHGNASVGKPSRPDFLLQTGELLQIGSNLRVVAFEDGFLPRPPRYVQRIVAVREAPATTPGQPPARYPLARVGESIE